MKWRPIFRGCLSVARTLSVIATANRLILRDTLRHPVRFEQLHRKLQITRLGLARRLRHLVESGILERRVYQQKPLRHDDPLMTKAEGLLSRLIPWWLGDQ